MKFTIIYNLFLLIIIFAILFLLLNNLYIKIYNNSYLTEDFTTGVNQLNNNINTLLTIDKERQKDINVLINRLNNVNTVMEQI